MTPPIYAYWSRVPSQGNFGDALTPWLIRRISGQHPVYLRADAPARKFLVTGSILADATSSCVVWGAGIMSRRDPVCAEATFVAVRGPLSRTRALECGARCPPVFGDPALLLPRFYLPSPGRRHAVGVVPHYSDRARLASTWRATDEIRMIDIQSGVEPVIDAIAGCDLVASSSLHGLIVSHAYGIPAIWIKFHDLPSGDDSKFYDYLLSVGLEPAPAVPVAYDAIDVKQLARAARVPGIGLDLRALWDTCPIRTLM